MAELPSFAAGDLPYTPSPEEPKDSNDALLKKALGGLNLGGFDPEAYGGLLKQRSEAAGEAAKAEAEQKRIAAQGKADAEKTYATGLRQQYMAAEPTLMSAPPKFNVTKDTQEGLTGLAALMTVGSLIIGSKGATSGVNAMNAMTGVLKGYQEGNQQRIDFETKKYEQSIKEWERSLQQTKESLDRYQKLASADLSAATAQAAAEAASKGQEVIAAKLRHDGFAQTISTVDKLIQQTAEANRKVANAFPRAQRPITVQGEDGKPYLMDPATRQPILDEQGNLLRPPPKSAQQIEDRGQRMINALSGVESAVTSINKLKSGATTGMLPYLSTKEGLISYLSSATGRAMSSDQEKFMNTYLAGIGRNLAVLEASGLATGLVSLSNSLQSGVYISAEEGAMSTANKLADIRRIAESAIQPVIEAGRISPEQKTTAQKILDKLREAVPFTTDDVADALMEKEKKAGKGKKAAPVTIGEQSRSIATGRAPVASVSPAPSGESENKRKAREAISKGAPRDVVIKRLQDAGEDISGL